MAFFCQNMLEIAAELAAEDPIYEDMASKFVEHFCCIASAMDRPGPGRHVGRGGRLLLRPAAAPDGSAMRLKVRSMVGLLPLCAARCWRSGSGSVFRK